MALISARELHVDTRISSVSLDVYAGNVVGVIGPNGAGKSTLLNTLAGLEQYEGQLLLDDKPAESYSRQQRARLVGLQPQQVNSAWSISVRDVVSLGRIPWGDQDEELINQAMHYTGVTALADRPIDHLSGGEQARVWLARVLAGQPHALLVDEPVASLDIHYQLAVMDLLQAYAKEGNAVVVAIHDLGLAARYCDHICLLHKGERISFGTPAEVLTETTLSAVYDVEVDIDLQRQPPVVMAKQATPR